MFWARAGSTVGKSCHCRFQACPVFGNAHNNAQQAVASRIVRLRLGATKSMLTGPAWQPAARQNTLPASTVTSGSPVASALGSSRPIGCPLGTHSNRARCLPGLPQCYNLAHTTRNCAAAAGPDMPRTSMRHGEDAGSTAFAARRRDQAHHHHGGCACSAHKADGEQGQHHDHEHQRDHDARPEPLSAAQQQASCSDADANAKRKQSSAGTARMGDGQQQGHGSFSNGSITKSRPRGCCSSHSHHRHSGHHHHHYHSDATATTHPVIKALDRIGFLQLAEHLEEHVSYTAVSVACFAASLLLPYAAAAGLLSSSLASTLAAVSMTVTFVLSGIPQLAETAEAFASGRVDTHVLMSFSVLGTLYLHMPHEGALLLLLFRVSHLLEHKLTQRATGSLERLFATVPQQATIVEVEASGAPVVSTATEVTATTVNKGQHVLVRPGEQAPLDGVIVWGTSNCSMQHITGESAPVRLEPGKELPAGSLSTDGLLVVRVTAGTEDSTPARIARMAQEAQASKPKLQRTLDRVGEVWSKAVIGATIATAVLLPLVGVPFLGERGALYRAMGVLTAGSPCALALVPLAYACAIAAITMKGVLIKSGAALDALGQCGTVALDKTGTITTGSLSLTEGYVLPLEGRDGNGSGRQPGKRMQLRPFEGQHWGDNSSNGSDSSFEEASSSGNVELERQALKFGTALSRLSNHPVSRAVVDALPDVDGDVSVESFEQVPGSGVQGVASIGDGPPMLVRFGALDWVGGFLQGSAGAAGLKSVVEAQHGRPSRAIVLLTASPLLPSGDAGDATALGTFGEAPPFSVQRADGSNDGGSGVFVAPAAEAPSHIVMLCFEDIIQPGVKGAVDELLTGGWGRRNRSSWMPGSGSNHAADAKQVVMLTGDSKQVAAAVARAVGIADYQAALKPEDKLAYVQRSETASTSADAVAAGDTKGLMMVGDGINDAPALAAARVGVAVATTPSDMVASAADVIILNGQGVTNLPWLFGLAQRTQMIIQQNLILALVSVAVATLPTVAGLFPLWLAVTLHEGSTLLVALNSLRLLLQQPGPSNGSSSGRGGSDAPSAFATASSLLGPKGGADDGWGGEEGGSAEGGSAGSPASPRIGAGDRAGTLASQSSNELSEGSSEEGQDAVTAAGGLRQRWGTTG